jgi:hypothetical protein
MMIKIRLINHDLSPSAQSKRITQYTVNKNGLYPEFRGRSDLGKCRCGVAYRQFLVENADPVMAASFKT